MKKKSKKRMLNQQHQEFIVQNASFEKKNPVRILLNFHHFPLPMDIYDWFAQTISSFAHCMQHSHKHASNIHGSSSLFLFPHHKSLQFLFLKFIAQAFRFFYLHLANSKQNNVIFDRFQSKSIQNFSPIEICDCSKQTKKKQ